MNNQHILKFTYTLKPSEGFILPEIQSTTTCIYKDLDELLSIINHISYGIKGIEIIGCECPAFSDNVMTLWNLRRYAMLEKIKHICPSASVMIDDFKYVLTNIGTVMDYDDTDGPYADFHIEVWQNNKFEYDFLFCSSGNFFDVNPIGRDKKAVTALTGYSNF